MATDPKRQKFLRSERERLTRHQHRHQGLSFLELWLPPTTDQEVNVIGINNHVYKGKVPAVPEDQLPPGIDEKSIDEEALFREIRDMRFPIVAPLETLGPIRRVGGEYTTAKRMNFAPVAIHMDRDKMQVPVVGRDGKIYRGATDTSEETEDMKTTSRPEISPTLVSLYVDGKPAYERKKPVPLIQMPHADLTRLVKVMRAQNPEYWREREMEKATVEPSEPVEKAESEGEEASAESSKESVTSVTSTEGEASEPEEPTSSEPEPSSESSKEPTPSETEPSSESSKEPMPSELEPSMEPSGIEEAEVEVEI